MSQPQPEGSNYSFAQVIYGLMSPLTFAGIINMAAMTSREESGCFMYTLCLVSEFVTEMDAVS